MLFPFISNSSQIIVTGTKQLFVPVRYLFLTIKQLLKPFIIAPCFKEELWMLTSRLLFCFALCQLFFLEEFSSFVAFTGGKSRGSVITICLVS